MTMKKTATKPVKKTLPKIVTKTGKVFILDTSVILHDPGCIYNFEKHDVVIPIHVVDKLRYLKKDLNYNQAIEFCRTLDSLTEDNVFNGGIKIGDSLGMLQVLHSVPISKAIRNDFGDPDSVVKTISLALSLQKQKPDKSITIVSKDPAVRVLAKSFSILAEDYKFDRVSDISFLSEDVKELQMGSDFINSLYKEKNY
jgi:PhoH-like ATPase